MDSSISGPSSDVRKPGYRNACEACRKRKVKCTGETPVCSRCTKQGKTCQYLERAPTLSVRRTRSPPDTSPTYHAHPYIRRHRPNSSTPAGGSPTRHSGLVNAAGLGMEEDTGFRGLIETATVDDRAQSPANGVPHFPFRSQLIRPLSAAPELLPAPPPRVEQIGAADVPSITVDLTSLPNEDQVISLIDHFGSHTSAAFPILHLPTTRGHARSALRGERIEKVQACILYLTLAISSRTRIGKASLRDSNSEKSHVYFSKAKELLEGVYDGSPSLPKLQVRLLHLQYALLSPLHGNIWELSGATLRLAIDLGCHHERGSMQNHHLELDMRRRLFWSAYCVDRNLSIALGRPPGIPDIWINTQLFSDLSDELDSSRSSESTPSSPAKLAAIHHVRIRQLQSEIQEKLYTPAQQSNLASTPSQEWFVSVKERLTLWRQRAPPPMGFCSTPWLDLNYHITLTLLNRPSPRNPKPSKESLRITRQAASAVMRTYKEMLKTGRVNWNWLAMYQLFIVGIAYLNSLWQAAEQGWTIVPSYVEALLDVQVCTSVMSSLSAITPGLTSLCSAFEALSERIIRQLTSKASWSAISRAPSPTLHDQDLMEPPLEFGSGSQHQHRPISTTGTSDYMHPGLDTTLVNHAVRDEYRPQQGIPTDWDSLDHNDNLSFDISAFQSEQEQVNVDNFLADLGFGNESTQTTFDHLFLHPLPDFPVDDWGAGSNW